MRPDPTAISACVIADSPSDPGRRWLLKATAIEAGGLMRSLPWQQSQPAPLLMAQSGVKAIVPLVNGIAVVAGSYWHAKRALMQVPPVFDAGPRQRRQVRNLGPHARAGVCACRPEKHVQIKRRAGDRAPYPSDRRRLRPAPAARFCRPGGAGVQGRRHAGASPVGSRGRFFA